MAYSKCSAGLPTREAGDQRRGADVGCMWGAFQTLPCRGRYGGHGSAEPEPLLREVVLPGSRSAAAGPSCSMLTSSDRALREAVISQSCREFTQERRLQRGPEPPRLSSGGRPGA